MSTTPYQPLPGEQLKVLHVSEELCLYTFQATRKMARANRGSLGMRLENAVLKPMDHILRANDVFLSPDMDDKTRLSELEERVRLQNKAKHAVHSLTRLAHVMFLLETITGKQYTQIAKKSTSLYWMIVAWRDSDLKRWGVPESPTGKSPSKGSSTDESPTDEKG
ncbi:MAG: hypothetical protein FWG78_03575 [Coriobacteriia bacterium]|nr:hypothetical protein [Coriobacteriia bacterium]